MLCSCCGLDRPTVAMQCHAEIGVCADCIGWLRTKAGIVDTTPTLPVRDMGEAVEFWQAAGIHVHLWGDGGFGFGHYDDTSVFDLRMAENGHRCLGGLDSFEGP